MGWIALSIVLVGAMVGPSLKQIATALTIIATAYTVWASTMPAPFQEEKDGV